MPDAELLRTSRELFLATLSGGAIDIDSSLVDRLTALFEEEDVEAGQRIYAAGEHCEFIYFLGEGRLRMLREGYASWTLEGRRVFGVFDVILGRPHERTAVALTDLHLLRVRGESWIELLEDNFDMVRIGVVNSARIVAGLEARWWATQPEPRGRVSAKVPAVLGSPLPLVDRLVMIADTDIFRGAGVQVLADLVGLMEEVSFEPGQLVYQRGQPRDGLFLLLSGQVIGQRTDPDLTVIFGPGSIACGVASLGAPILAWEARAREKVRALYMRLEDLFDMMEEHFDLARSALSTLAQGQEGLLDELARKTGDIVMK